MVADVGPPSSMTSVPEPTHPAGVKDQSGSRILVLDLARGIAVVAMIIYHLSWDLSWFAFVSWPVAESDGWRSFAISIAASFLFFAGVSLDLAHHKKIRWPSFWKREVVIVAAAICVSIGTYFAFGENFVRFGILHCIAVSSLIALPFIRLPLVVSASLGAVFIALPNITTFSSFDGDLLLWTGLGEPAIASVDYVPLFPWTGAALLGVAASKLSRKFALNEQLSKLPLQGPIGQSLRWMGRRSLPIYLLHQPLLYGLVWSVAWLGLGPDSDRISSSFQRNCTASCTENTGDAENCEAACSCTLSNLKSQELWDPLLADPENPELQSKMNGIYSLCLSDPNYLNQ